MHGQMNARTRRACSKAAGRSFVRIRREPRQCAAEGCEPVGMAKENRIDVKKDRGGSVSRLNLFYFVIQIIVHRNEDPVLFRDRPDCPGEDLYLRRLLPETVLRHRGHGVRGE